MNTKLRGMRVWCIIKVSLNQFLWKNYVSHATSMSLMCASLTCDKPCRQVLRNLTVTSKKFADLQNINTNNRPCRTVLGLAGSISFRGKRRQILTMGSVDIRFSSLNDALMPTTSSSTKYKSSCFKRGEIRFRSLELARSKRGEHLSLIKIHPFSEIPTGQFKAHFITLSFRRAIKTNSSASISFERNILHDSPEEVKTRSLRFYGQSTIRMS